MSPDPLSALLASFARPGARVRAQGLRGSSRAYLVSRILSRLQRPMVVLASNTAEGRAFAAELQFFLGGRPDPQAPPWEAPVVFFPSWDATVFEHLTPPPEVSAERTAALVRARHGGPFVLVAPVDATMQRLAPPDALDRAAALVSAGETADRDDLVRGLLAAGYQRVAQVEERGEVSVRGGIVDLFAPHYPQPIRLEFFGDEIESIRCFDPATQRSTTRVESAVLLPAREVVAGEEAVEEALARLRRRCHKMGFNRSQTAEALEPFRSAPFGPLRECFPAYFYEETASFWDYFPSDAVVALDVAADVEERVAQFAEETERQYARAAAAGRFAPEPAEAYLDAVQWASERGPRPVLEIEPLERASGAEGSGPEVHDFFTVANDDLVAALRRHRGVERLLTPLVAEIEEARSRGNRVCLVARGPGSAQKVRDFLAEYGVTLGGAEPFAPPAPEQWATVGLCLGSLDRGFRFPGERLVLITEAEIFGLKGRRPPPRRGMGRFPLAELAPGDLVVHADFGIGRFQGMVRLTIQDEEGDYLHLEYADGDRLYLPVTRLNLLQRYTAPGEGEARLDKIGGKGWEKARKKAHEGIEKMAHELLDLYARRALAERPPYGAPDLACREFAATFPYEETPDQAAAIDDVSADMGRPRPMDRLICGDVGYGKTEVAIRAAFRAVHDGRQVAVLTPTTVLAAQHYQNFRRRFEGYPFTVEMMSRFVGREEQAEAARRISAGGVDIVVGTHRLLARDIRFKSLGLVVVDEEHRFGVAQKEKLKALRHNVDMLSLSATPIPRTLQMGFTGVRDLSVIETPPADRLAVRTRLARFDDDVVREAVRREIARGGQVYFVHNRVQSIGQVAEHLRTLLPGVRFTVAHGQMNENDLRRAMETFAAGETDVLVCTAIIESGLDIPTANTILINRADRFGLADLYQLRGRVGRSNVRAYCYLLVPEERDLTADAHKRLQTIQQFTELGAGFKVAIHDLEIRGAGELLGENQSGHIAAIGFDLYAELLEEAVRRLRGEPVRRPPEPEIRLRVPTHFPESYVPDATLRLALYERLTQVVEESAFGDVRYEFIDRFGPIPQPVENLIELMKIRLHMMRLRASELTYTGKELVVAFDEEPAVSPERVVALLAAEPARCRLTPDQRLKWQTGVMAENHVFAAARELLSRLG